MKLKWLALGELGMSFFIDLVFIKRKKERNCIEKTQEIGNIARMRS